MATDVSNGAAFWYHLGDVVYYFGQDQYYFEQFLTTPIATSNAPIFAIPGNHDGARCLRMKPRESLDAFVANCLQRSATHTIPIASGAASAPPLRTSLASISPLNAPFVKVLIGLYSEHE